jgi:rhodanese-related sulfurtransferase
MQAHKFFYILGVSGFLALYSAWLPSSHRASIPTGPVGNEIPLIRLDRAKELWEEPSSLFLDVRSANDYQFGHIPGSVSLPETDFESRFPALQERLRRARTLVVYCKSPDCGLSLWAAIRLRNEGLTQVVIYPGGWNDWFNRGLPVARPTSGS